MPGFTIDLEGLNLNNEQERAIQDDIRKADLARILDLRDIDQTQLQRDIGNIGNAGFVGMKVRHPKVESRRRKREFVPVYRQMLGRFC